MRLTAMIAGVFLFVLILGIDNQRAHAEIYKDSMQPTSSGLELVLKKAVKEDKVVDPAPTVGRPTEYIVIEGDTLVKIAQEHTETWQRLFSKNPQIADPNVIQVGDKIVIPTKEEILTERALPILQSTQIQTASMNMTPSNQVSKQVNTAPPQAVRGSSAGNNYSSGYCTWYAKQRRPDLPNNLGNAITWVARAGAQGLSTGSTPRAGAIGQQGNHVVYVEAVNPNGTITISEMNYKGLGIVSSRTVPASAFQYIY